MLLWFLGEAPAYGYELIKRFHDVSRGYYSPSPGVVYPALSQLETLGFAEVELSGKRKNYQITSAGLEHLQAYIEHTQPLLAILKHAAKKMLWISQASESEAAAAEATGWLPEFIQARKTFRSALLTKSEADHAEQRRVIAILQRAAQEILKKPANQ
ncbi:MAG: PadR family transcriptional regulator [Burkholderiaceae bacterium]|nr:PadR family transcriptional regulator [Burkholderiaceae bacterium]